MNFKLFFTILITLFFFSTSSLLCRAALMEGSIDAYSFTSYAICFSYAYINLDAGLGALILFAVVQLSILSQKKN